MEEQAIYIYCFSCDVVKTLNIKDNPQYKMAFAQNLPVYPGITASKKLFYSFTGAVMLP